MNPSVSLVMFCWGNECLNAFHLIDSNLPSVDLKAHAAFKDKRWHQAMAALYPEMSLVELARLWVCVCETRVANADFDTDDNEWMQSFGWQNRDELMEILKLILKTPIQFQNWAAEKKLGQRELRPLLLIKNFPEHYSILGELPKSNPSRNEGALMLELLVELLLMDMGERQIIEALNLPVDEAIAEFRKLRYPQRTGLQQSMESKAKKLPWPKKSQIKWNFLKDQPSLEFKTLIHSEEEFYQLLESLKLIEAKLKSKDSNPWLP